MWRKRLWRCGDPDCEAKSWSERCDAIAPRASLTARGTGRHLRPGGQGRTLGGAVAAHYGVGWATAMGAVSEHGAPLVDDAARIGEVDQLGLDETAFQAANAKRHTSYVTGMVDTKRGAWLTSSRAAMRLTCGDGWPGGPGSGWRR